jgi:DNA-directed RNA polymerase subunit RPC12/RpoP
MNCWHCGHELVWGGDHDIEEMDEDYVMETNLSCPNCNSFILVYLPKQEEEK